MSMLEKMRPGDYVLCMWSKNFEWRAYRVRNVVGGEKESFRSDLEFRPQSSAWASESVMVRTTECSVRNFGQIDGETPNEMSVVLKELSSALNTMRDEQKRARDRYVVLVSLLLPPPQ